MNLISRSGNVSAVLLAWNCGEVLERNLPRLLQDAGLYRQIIVVDQASTDTTEHVVRRHPEVTHVRLERNRGSGRGRNVGLRAALADPGTEYVYSLDADIVVPLNLGRRFRAALETFPELHLLGASHPDCQTTDLALVDETIPDITGYFYVTMLSYTYCAMQRREFYDRIASTFGTWWNEEGPFGQPGWGADDNDFAFRGWKAGCHLAGFADLVWPDGTKRPPRIYHVDHRCYDDLYRETGVWPNQYDSTYERRTVLLHLDWASGYGMPVDTVHVLLHRGGLDAIKQAVRGIHGDRRWHGIDYSRRRYRIVVPSMDLPHVTAWLWDKGCRWTPNDPEANWAVRPIDGGEADARRYADFYHPQASVVTTAVE